MSKYTQLISDKLREDIEEYMETNHLKAGDRLPSERMLAQMFEANRVTLRKALQQMSGEGKIYSIPGQGTFIAQPKFFEDAAGSISFSGAWNQEGHRVTNKLIQFSMTDSNLKTSQLLGVPLASKVYELRRLRLIDDIPISIETSYLLEETCPGLIRFDFSRNRALYQTLKEEYGIEIIQQQQNIRAAKLRPDEADLLCADPEASAFYISAVGVAKDGRPMERSLSITRADRYGISYHVVLENSQK